MPNAVTVLTLTPLILSCRLWLFGFLESSKSDIFNIHRVNYDETEGAVVQLPLLTDPTVVFKVVEGEESWLRKQDGCKIIVAVSSNPVGWLLAQVINKFSSQCGDSSSNMLDYWRIILFGI